MTSILKAIRRIQNLLPKVKKLSRMYKLFESLALVRLVLPGALPLRPHVPKQVAGVSAAKR